MIAALRAFTAGLNAWLVAAVIFVVGAGGIWVQQARVTAAKERANGYQMQYQAIRDLLQINDAALATCEALNAENATRYADALHRAELAEAEALQAEGAATERVNQIHVEAKRHATDTECRTLADPLPADFVRWLRD